MRDRVYKEVKVYTENNVQFKVGVKFFYHEVTVTFPVCLMYFKTINPTRQYIPQVNRDNPIRTSYLHGIHSGAPIVSLYPSPYQPVCGRNVAIRWQKEVHRRKYICKDGNHNVIVLMLQNLQVILCRIYVHTSNFCVILSVLNVRQFNP